jgi:hypothetical protein
MLYQIAKISHEPEEMHLQTESPSRCVVLGTLINGLVQYIVLIYCIVLMSIDSDFRRWVFWPHRLNVHVHFMGAGIYL